jgi:hypothetical protein
MQAHLQQSWKLRTSYGLAQLQCAGTLDAEMHSEFQATHIMAFGCRHTCTHCTVKAELKAIGTGTWTVVDL